MNFLKAVVAVGFLVSIAGCGAKGKEHADAAEAFEKKMCACTDQACAHGVAAEFNEWIGKNKETKVSKENHDKIMASVQKLAECAKKDGEPNADKLDDTVPAAE